jgi:hypothetical protein
MNLANSWKQYFLNKLVDSTNITVAFQEFAVHLESATIDKYIELATRSAFKCFAFIDPEDHHVRICHHFHLRHDGSWAIRGDYYVALSGFGAQATPITLSKTHLFEAKHRAMPLNKALNTTATTKDHLSQLKDKTVEDSTALIPLLTQIPPFLLGTLLDTTTSDPAELFFIIRTAINAHANTISQGLTTAADKKDAIDGAWESSFYFLQFLWAATNYADELALPYTETSDFGDAWGWCTFIHQSHILGPPSTTPPAPSTPGTGPMDQATASLVQAASALSASTDRLVDSRLFASQATLGSKAWEKQASFNHEFVFRLMARNEESNPSQPTDTLVQFLSLSSNTSAALQYIKNFLQSTLHCQDIRMDPFTVVCLSQLSLDFDLAEGPARLSLFMLFDPATSLVYSTNDDIIDQATIDAKGEYGMNYDQFKSKVSEKKTLWAPLNVNDFQTTFRTMHGILFFLFGDCFATDQIATWTSHIETNRASYKHCQAQDWTFFAQQLTIADHALQAFFRNARAAHSIEELGFGLLSFDNQQHAIAVCTPMTVLLHPRVQALFPGTKIGPHSVSLKKRSHEQLSKAREEGGSVNDSPQKNLGRMMQNTKQDPTFKLKRGLSYRDVFNHELLRNKLPSVNGTQLCCRWQVVGRCYENCTRSAQHVALKDEAKRAFTKFFNEAVAEANLE